MAMKCFICKVVELVLCEYFLVLKFKEKGRVHLLLP